MCRFSSHQTRQRYKIGIPNFKEGFNEYEMQKLLMTIPLLEIVWMNFNLFEMQAKKNDQLTQQPKS